MLHTTQHTTHPPTLQANRAPLPEEAVRFYIANVVVALEHIHSKGYIHRDINPENLLIDRSGYLKLADFGFAKKLVGGRTWTICGTYGYCAPELLSSDLYDQAGITKAVDW